MASKVTIDYINKLFIAKVGVRSLDVAIDIYSDYKEDVKPSMDDQLGRSPLAIRAIGGDPISPIQDAGSTFFMLNGWRIRPDEADHELEIVGNLFTAPVTEALVVPTLGTFTVLIKQKVSNLVDSSVARLDLTQLLPAVYIDSTNGTAGTVSGIGTPTNPSSNLADATTIANRDNLTEFILVNTDIVLTQNLQNWTFTGKGPEFNSSVDIAGFNVGGCKFKSVVMLGTMQGKIAAECCGINLISGLDGLFRSCGFQVNFSIAASANVTFADCFSEISGAIVPVATIGSGASAGFRNYSGGLELRGMTVGNIVSVDLDPGDLVINADVSGGILRMRGVGGFTNNGTGLTIIDDGFFDTKRSSIATATLIDQLVTNPVTGNLELWNPAGDTLLYAWPLTDNTGFAPYDGTFNPDKRGIRVDV